MSGDEVQDGHGMIGGGDHEELRAIAGDSPLIPGCV